jgi:hypothetical protein
MTPPTKGQRTVNDFLLWLARSPIASAAKVASGAVLVWVLDNVTDLGLHPVVQVAIVAAVPVLINAVNPADDRYGRHGYSTPEPDYPGEES